MKKSSSKSRAKKQSGVSSNPEQKAAPAAAESTTLPFDLEHALKTISKADPVMKQLIKQVGTCSLELAAMQNCFETLLEAIVYQQLTAKAASTILKRVKGLFSDSFPSPSQIIAAPEADLRGAGLSRAKSLALKDLACKTENGSLPLLEDLADMQDSEIIEAFTSVRGIGEWTVQMLLIFRLGRPDVMAHKDYGLRKGYARAYALEQLPSPLALLSHSEKWRPYRTVASWYLWRVPPSKTNPDAD